MTLQYLGVPEVLASALSEGTYYIRTNVNYGTDKSPEYRYLDAGGNSWGTDPTISTHGMALELVNTKKTDENGRPIYSIKSMLQQGGSETSGKKGHGRMFDGLHYDHGLSEFVFEKVHPNDEESYEYWMKSLYAHYSENGCTQEKKGYVVQKDGNSLDLLDVSSAPTNAQSAVWEIVTKIQRVKELQESTYDNPMDATFFIEDPSFGRNNIGKKYWNLEVDNSEHTLPRELGDNGNDASNKRTYGNIDISIGTNKGYKNEADYQGNKYDFNVVINGNNANKASYNLSQKVNVDNLPTGVYRLSVHGYTNVDGGAVLFASDENGEIEYTDLYKVTGTYSELKDHKYAAYWFTGNDYMANQDKLSTAILNAYKRDDMYCKEMLIKVTSNNLTVGVRGELNQDGYAVIDNFELYFLGEAAQDISNVSEPVELYMYNVEAGRYLNERGVTNTSNADEVKCEHFATLKEKGERFFVESIGNNKYYIYRTEDNGTKHYLSIYDGSDDAKFVYTYGSRNTNSVWTITKKTDDNIYVIKDASGRCLQWTGDTHFTVYTGLEDDKEPRGARWSFYEPGQYQKDRMFVTIASSIRKDYWRVIRSAIVNMRDLKGKQTIITGLDTAFNKLDAVWISPLASSYVLKQKASDLKNLIIDAMTEHGSHSDPVDVSFFINDAGFGDFKGGSNAGEWKITGQWRNSEVFSTTPSGHTNKVNKVAIFDKYAFVDQINDSRSISQVLKEKIPAGKYKLALDFSSKTAYPANYEFYIKSLNDNSNSFNSSGVYNGATSNTLISEDFIEFEDPQDVEIGIIIKSGTARIDNFKLYFCGNVNGKLKFNSDSTEMTIVGDWDTRDEMCNKVKEKISKKKEKLGTVFVYKNNFVLNDDNYVVNVTTENWQNGSSQNNVLFYTDIDELTGTSNVVRKKSDDTYTCDNLVITDRMTMHVPYEFTAKTVSYSRENSISTGTLCLPLDLTKMPTGINKLYIPEKIDWETSPEYGRLKLTDYSSGDAKVVLPANTPVFYNGEAESTIMVSESNSLIHKTSELPTPKPEEDDLSVYGTYKYKYVVGESGVDQYGTKNVDGLSANECYYVKSNNTLVRGKHWFNIGAFRAFVYRGKGEMNNVRPSVLYVDFDDVIVAVSELAEDDAVVVGYYDVKGVCYDKPQKGLNIILYSDGARRKIYVK